MSAQHTAEIDPRLTRVAAALGGEHRVPVYSHDGRRIAWRTAYISGPEAEVLAAAALRELRDIPSAVSAS